MKFTFPPESRVLDGYTIKRAIHRGGFGEVYYALSDAGREVALKLLQNNSEVELRGVQQCLNLSHSNLVTIFDVRQDGDGDHWILMEYIGGETLDAAIRRHPQGMPMEQVRKWLSGIAAGVAHLHSRGLVHRDLKPANVFSDAGAVKVGDVGLSKFIAPSRRSAHTQSVGTVYYMAPEVAKGRYGKEVDVYALGIMLVEMLTGHVPFDGESTAEILMKHLSESPDLSKLPQRLQPVLAKALAKDPEQRYRTIDGFAKAFDDAVLGKGPIVSPESTTGTLPVMTLSRTSVGVQKPYSADAAPTAHSPGERQSTTSAATSETRSPLSLPLFFSAVLWGAGAGVAMFALLLNWAPSGAQPVIWLPFLVAFTTGVATLIAKSSTRGFGIRGLASSSDVNHTLSQYRPLAASPFAWRTRMAHWVTSAALSTGIGGGLLAGTVAMAPSLFTLDAKRGVAPELVAYFGATALVACWLLTLAGKLTATWAPLVPIERRHGLRRVVLMFAGLATGAAAWGLANFLQLDLSRVFAGQEMDGLFDSIGERSLVGTINGRAAPTLLAFMVFFGSLFGLRSWWRQVDLLRASRFRAASVLMTVLLAWLTTAIFSFPQTWAILWAAVISATVQLASPWSPPVSSHDLRTRRE
ncbi:MAG: serine/threonine-protein kinase [Planctomycetaceae bacterium]